MLTRKSSILLLAGAFLSVPLTVAAQGKGVTATAAGKGGVVSVEALVTRYNALAGPWAPNNGNANSLVDGVRNGGTISLYGPLLALKLEYPPAPPPTTPPPPPPICKMPPCPPAPAVKTTSSAPKPEPKKVIVMDTITFPSPIGNTGYGNVDIALALAEADFRSKVPSATSATPEQLRAALLGGTVATAPGATTNVTFLGVLKLRSEGNGWGEVAKTLGFDLK